jgi:multidrug resistance efflux pump
MSILLAGCGLHGRSNVERKHVQSSAPFAPELATPERVVAPGVVEAWGGEVALAPREPGWIAEIRVEEGEHVTSGQTVAVLDDELQLAAVHTAEADFADAEAMLAKTLRGATAEERRQAQADVLANDARAALARSNARRMNGLGEKDAVAAAEVERAFAESDTQVALADSAAARLHAIERGARAEDRTSARARLAAAQAKLEFARANLARRRVLSPKEGTVLTSRFHAGEFFEPGSGALFIVGDVSRLRIRLEVDEIDSSRLEPGASCAIYGDDNTYITDGTLYQLAPKMGRRGLPIEAPTARADVRVREVYVEVAPTSKLIPGQRVWGHATPAKTYASR